MRKFMLFLIKIYKGITKGSTKRCKYLPTCSDYSKECYEKFNFFKATYLTIWRLLRCNPFSRGGVDAPPLTKAEKLEQQNSINL